MKRSSLIPKTQIMPTHLEIAYNEEKNVDQYHQHHDDDDDFDNDRKPAALPTVSVTKRQPPKFRERRDPVMTNFTGNVVHATSISPRNNKNNMTPTSRRSGSNTMMTSSQRQLSFKNSSSFRIYENQRLSFTDLLRRQSSEQSVEMRHILTRKCEESRRSMSRTSTSRPYPFFQQDSERSLTVFYNCPSTADPSPPPPESPSEEFLDLSMFDIEEQQRLLDSFTASNDTLSMAADTFPAKGAAAATPCEPSSLPPVPDYCNENDDADQHHYHDYQHQHHFDAIGHHHGMMQQHDEGGGVEYSQKSLALSEASTIYSSNEYSRRPSLVVLSDSSRGSSTTGRSNDHTEEGGFSNTYYEKYPKNDHDVVPTDIAPTEGDGQANYNHCEDDNATTESTTMIEIVPNVSFPLRGARETWKAVLEGRIVVTTCYCCTCELTCVEDAGLVLCTDCWSFSPVDQNISSQTIAVATAGGMGGLPSSRQSVGLGVKPDDIFRFLDEQQQEQY